jgi:hypothetical protein
MQGFGEQGHDTFDVRQYFVVPKAHHPKPVRGEPPIAPFVPQRIGMLSAVDFDHEPFLEADKVGNEIPKRHLPAKLETGKSPIPKCEPQFPLSVSHASTHRTRSPAHR